MKASKIKIKTAVEYRKRYKELENLYVKRDVLLSEIDNLSNAIAAYEAGEEK